MTKDGLSRPKPWVIYKGGLEKHPRRKGPGRVNPNLPHRAEALASTAVRAANFFPNAPDAPKKASRTMPASWGR